MKSRPKNRLIFKSKGSALILTVVLTMLLSLIGITFIMIARINDSVSRSSSQTDELDSCTDAIIGMISKELTLDVPGVAGQEYYDYAGDKDPWLATIEPIYNDTDNRKSYWPQISDVTGYLRKNDIAMNNVEIKPPDRTVIKEYPEIELEAGKLDKGSKHDGLFDGQWADADGDGIADSKWIELEDYRTSTGEKVFAAVRVIDNCGMVNVNTALWLDMKDADMPGLVDGSMPSHVDLLSLLLGPNSKKSGVLGDGANIDLSYLYQTTSYNSDSFETHGIFSKRRPTSSKWWDEIKDDDPYDFIKSGFKLDDEFNDQYTRNKINYLYSWVYGLNGVDLKFDIADELKLRSRFCVLSPAKSDDFFSYSRLETLWPVRETASPNGPYFPVDQVYDARTDYGLSDWADRVVSDERFEKPGDFDNADLRHFITTYSLDRIINPDGLKQFALNMDNTYRSRMLETKRAVPGFLNYSNFTANVLYYTLVKAYCKGYRERHEEKKEGHSFTKPLDEEVVADFRRLAQLAVNIVDLRDTDTDSTGLDIKIYEDFFNRPVDGYQDMYEQYRYLDPGSDLTTNSKFGWYDKDTDIDPVEITRRFIGYSENRFVFGQELQPVISGVGISYTKYPWYDTFEDSANWADPGNEPNPYGRIFEYNGKEEELKAHYAVELYNPFDETLRLDSKEGNYTLVIRNVAGGSSRYLKLSDLGIRTISPKSFILICDDKDFWNSKFDDSDPNTENFIVENRNFVLSHSLDEQDKSTGLTERKTVDVRVRIPSDILLVRKAPFYFLADSGNMSYLGYDSICVDHQSLTPGMVAWDPRNGNETIKQRITMNSRGGYRNDNIEWWDCLWPFMYDPNSSELGHDLVKGSPNSKIDFSVPMRRYSDLPYFNTQLATDDDDLAYDRKIYTSRTFVDPNLPVLELPTVGDVAKVWAVGPKSMGLVNQKMESWENQLRNYIDYKVPRNIFDNIEGDPSSYDKYRSWCLTDPNEFNELNQKDFMYSIGDEFRYANKYSLDRYFDVYEYNFADPNVIYDPNDPSTLPYDPNDTWEYRVRLDLKDPRYSNIFQYLTVFDPSNDFIDNDGDNEADMDYYPVDHTKWGVHANEMLRGRSEWKVPGRINVNTAPWYVIAQLPWVKCPESMSIPSSFDNDEYRLAKAIVAYRDKLDKADFGGYEGESYADAIDKYDGRFTAINSELTDYDLTDLSDLVVSNPHKDDFREEKGFASIGELALVLGEHKYSIDKLGRNNNDIKGFPDLITDNKREHNTRLGDGCIDDFEEKNAILSRMSNVATVRSDVFTAYILVRTGVNGPQRRTVVVLDRSDVYPAYNMDDSEFNYGYPKGGNKFIGNVKVVGKQMVGDPVY